MHYSYKYEYIHSHTYTQIIRVERIVKTEIWQISGEVRNGTQQKRMLFKQPLLHKLQGHVYCYTTHFYHDSCFGLCCGPHKTMLWLCSTWKGSMDRGTDVQLTKQRSLLKEQLFFCSVHTFTIPSSAVNAIKFVIQRFSILQNMLHILCTCTTSGRINICNLRVRLLKLTELYVSVKWVHPFLSKSSEIYLYLQVKAKNY